MHDGGQRKGTHRRKSVRKEKEPWGGGGPRGVKEGRGSSGETALPPIGGGEKKLEASGRRSLPPLS